MQPETNTLSSDTAGESIFENSYYKDVQQDIWQSESRRTLKALMGIGLVLLLGDLVTLMMANFLTGATFLYSLVFPAFFAGLGILALRKPQLAMALGLGLFIVIIAITVSVAGGRALIGGFLAKGVIVYLFITGFRHAREAEAARHNLLAIH